MPFIACVVCCGVDGIIVVTRHGGPDDSKRFPTKELIIIIIKMNNLNTIELSFTHLKQLILSRKLITKTLSS